MVPSRFRHVSDGDPADFSEMPVALAATVKLA